MGEGARRSGAAQRGRGYKRAGLGNHAGSAEGAIGALKLWAYMAERRLAPRGGRSCIIGVASGHKDEGAALQCVRQVRKRRSLWPGCIARMYENVWGSEVLGSV
jgi:hypothetical protein